MGRGTNRFGTTITRLCGVAIAALAAGAMASLSTPGAAHAAVADAYCSGPPTVDAARGNNQGARWAQTFSPINGGYLTGVRLFVDEQARYGGTVTVQITPVNPANLVPLNPTQPLAQATVPDSSLPVGSYPYLDEVAFDFPNPPAVSASSEYAIVLTRSASSAVLGIGVKTDHVTGHGYPCPDGDLYDSPDATTPWGTNDGVDAVFSTFVGGAPTPAATGTGQRAAALKKCKKKKSDRARSACKKKAKNLPV